MIYLVSEAKGLELPLATAGSLNELSEICGIEVDAVCRLIRRKMTIKIFNGIPVKIYKFKED